MKSVARVAALALLSSGPAAFTMSRTPALAATPPPVPPPVGGAAAPAPGAVPNAAPPIVPAPAPLTLGGPHPPVFPVPPRNEIPILQGVPEPEMPPVENTNVDLTQTMSLDRAIQIALANQHQIGIAESQLEASKWRVRQDKAAFYPTVGPSFQYTDAHSVFDTGHGRTVTAAQSAVPQIGLQEVLFDTGQRAATVASDNESSHAATYNVLDVRQTVIETVSTDYYDLLREKELVKVAQANVDQANATLQATQAFVEAKTSARKDIYQAQADADNAEVQLIAAQNNVRLADTTLKNAMGVVSLAPVITPTTPLPPPDATPDTTPLQNYIDQAYITRADLKREAATIAANRQAVHLARIGTGLQVQGTLNEGYRVFNDPGEDRTIGTSVSYPLFDAAGSRARLREAQASLEQSERTLDLDRQQVVLDIETAYLQREQARAQVGAANTAVTAAQQNYDAARASQQEGVGDIIATITAQSQLVTAQTNAVQALFDYYTADARLKRAVGANDPYAASPVAPARRQVMARPAAAIVQRPGKTKAVGSYSVPAGTSEAAAAAEAAGSPAAGGTTP